MPDPLLQTRDLVKSFALRRGFFGQQRLRVLAVDRVSLGRARTTAERSLIRARADRRH